MNMAMGKTLLLQLKKELSKTQQSRVHSEHHDAHIRSFLVRIVVISNVCAYWWQDSVILQVFANQTFFYDQRVYAF